MTHTTIQLQAMTDAELSRVAFELGLAPEGVKDFHGMICYTCIEVTDSVNISGLKHEREFVASYWNPCNDLNQAAAMCNKHFFAWEKRSEETYLPKGQDYEMHVVWNICDENGDVVDRDGYASYGIAGQEARALTICCILAREAKK